MHRRLIPVPLDGLRAAIRRRLPGPVSSIVLLFLPCELPAPAVHASTPAGVTFNREIAPIIYGHCVICHHPDGIAPFSLASYADVKKHARQIKKVTASRYMPPWLPEPHEGRFLGERRLADDDIALIGRWAEAGAPQGAAADLKAKPEWNGGWQLGPPDLVLTMPQPYALSAEGKDVYRNFILHVPAEQTRYVRAMEFHPGNPRVVHHSVLMGDAGGWAQRLDAKDGAPGFDGMDPGHGISSPAGHFVGWQPGKLAEVEPEGMSWVLPKGNDLVLQLHMHPSGKPETVQASVGLYFTDDPPTKQPYLLGLRRPDIDIPAGAKDYSITNSYELPVDVQVLSVSPHAHYLAKEMQAWATRPDGSREWLIHIKDWDFAWQGDYRMAEPVDLPKGTTIAMRYFYDNSADNIRNPSHPPKRVHYGLNTTDEMGEFWLQVLPRRPEDLPVLERDFLAKVAIPDKLARSKFMVGLDPHNASERTELAVADYANGYPYLAITEARRALQDDPKMVRAYALLGQIYLHGSDLPKAETALSQAVAIDPEDWELQNNFGNVLLLEGRSDEAAGHFEKSLSLNPGSDLARQNLAKIRGHLGK